MSACHSFLLNSNVNERKVLFDLTDRVTDRMRRRALKKGSKKRRRKSEDTHHICAPFKLPKELNTSMQFCLAHILTKIQLLEYVIPPAAAAAAAADTPVGEQMRISNVTNMTNIWPLLNHRIHAHLTRARHF